MEKENQRGSVNRVVSADSRDQLNQNQVENAQNVSFLSRRSSSSTNNRKLPKGKAIQPYVSPFVLNAKKRAEDRVKRTRLSAAARAQLTGGAMNNNWDNTPARSGLFDPSIKKQEIFKLEPRNAVNQSLDQEVKSSHLALKCCHLSPKSDFSPVN